MNTVTIPQPGDPYPLGYCITSMVASTSRATISGMTVSITYEAAPPARIVLRRYTLAPRTPLMAWLLILMSALLAVASLAPVIWGHP